MLLDRYKINLSSIASGATATTINIPISLELQLVDQSELVETVFVDVETEKAINPIIDYEKVRFTPIDLNNEQINSIIYVVDLLGNTTYGSIGFTDDDIKYENDSFKQTFLNLNFYDSDNPLSQNLVTYVTLYSEIKPSDLLATNGVSGSMGQPKPANQIPITYVLNSPLFNQRSFSEGYYLYDYKDELAIGEYKYLYMRASFNNAKTGKSTNMMVKDVALPIDSLIHQLYTRFKLIRTNSGFSYQIDNTYNGDGSINPNNITYSNNQSLNSVVVNLYEINAI